MIVTEKALPSGGETTITGQGTGLSYQHPTTNPRPELDRAIIATRFDDRTEHRRRIAKFDEL